MHTEVSTEMAARRLLLGLHLVVEGRGCAYGGCVVQDRVCVHGARVSVCVCTGVTTLGAASLGR